MNGYTPYPTEPDIAMIVGTMVVIFGISLLIGFIIYLFQALALFKMAKTRGLNNPWLSFIPVVNIFTMGAIADHTNHLINKKSSFRIWLLALNIITLIFSVFFFFVYFNFILDGTMFSNDPNAMMSAMMPLMGLAGIMSLIGIALAVLTYIALYRIFADYAPSSAVAFLILSILFGIQPFLLFAIRNKPSISVYCASQPQQPYQQQPYQQQPYQQQPYQQQPYQQQPYQQQPYQQQPYQQQPYQQQPQTQQPYKQYAPLFEEPVQPTADTENSEPDN